MDIDSVALTVTAFAAGGWATITSLQLRALRRHSRRLERKIDALVDHVFGPGAARIRWDDADYRYSRGVLDDAPARIPGAHRQL